MLGRLSQIFPVSLQIPPREVFGPGPPGRKMIEEKNEGYSHRVSKAHTKAYDEDNNR